MNRRSSHRATGPSSGGGGPWCPTPLSPGPGDGRAVWAVARPCWFAAPDTSCNTHRAVTSPLGCSKGEKIKFFLSQKIFKWNYIQGWAKVGLQLFTGNIIRSLMNNNARINSVFAYSQQLARCEHSGGHNKYLPIEKQATNIFRFTESG